MSAHPMVVVHGDAAALAEAAAARLVIAIVEAQNSRGWAHIVLTGGGVGIATLVALAAIPGRDAIDWHRIDIWFGDERFLPSGDPDRNETQARHALLDQLDLDPGRLHPMASSDGRFGLDVDAGARAYAEELAAAAGSSNQIGVPSFDVVMLGMGPDAHIASLFPEHPGVYEVERSVIAVRSSPKPPPTRISLTFPAINQAREVWLLAAGSEKAAAVSMALAGAGDVAVPAAGVQGHYRTLWLLDRAAAAEVPPALTRIASP